MPVPLSLTCRLLVLKAGMALGGAEPAAAAAVTPICKICHKRYSKTPASAKLRSLTDQIRFERHALEVSGSRMSGTAHAVHMAECQSHLLNLCIWLRLFDIDIHGLHFRRILADDVVGSLNLGNSRLFVIQDCGCMVVGIVSSIVVLRGCCRRIFCSCISAELRL